MPQPPSSRGGECAQNLRLFVQSSRYRYPDTHNVTREYPMPISGILGYSYDMPLDPFKNLILTSDLLLLVGEIDEFKGAWKALGSLAPDRLATLRQIATVESVGASTRIEGARLTTVRWTFCCPTSISAHSGRGTSRRLRVMRRQRKWCSIPADMPLRLLQAVFSGCPAGIEHHFRCLRITRNLLLVPRPE